MKTLRTEQVYVVDGCTEDQLCSDRLERMMRSIHAESVTEVTCEQMDRIAAERGGRFGEPGSPHLIFTRFRWRLPAEEEEVQKKYPHLTGGLRRVWGAEQFKVAGGFHNPWDGAICRPLWDTTPLQGCYHGCTYCSCARPGYVCFSLNLEEVIERNDEMMKLVPWQKNWHTGGVTDIFCFEPEYGYTALLLDSAARHDRYVLFYTSTDNVEFLFDLERRDRAIIEWTISPSSLVRFEKKAPSLSARLDAMKRCKDAGCTVRCQFAPMMALAGWKEDYRAMIRELFATVEPDLVAVHMIRCPRPARRALQEWLGPDAIDPDYAALLPEAGRDGDEARFPGDHILPHEARSRLNGFVIEEIRSIDSEVPIALCRETPEMWAEFEADLGLSPAQCACGLPPRSGGPGR